MRAAFHAAIALGFTTMACNALLGIDDQHLRPDAQGPAAAVDGGTADGSAADAGDADGGGAYVEAVMNDGPAFYVRFDDLAGPSAAETVAHLDGTYPVAGATLRAPGALLVGEDTAVQLAGSSDIRFPDGVDFAGTAPFSVEIWIRRSPNDPDAFVIDHESYPRRGWSLYVSGSGAFFERWSDTEHVVAAGDGLPDDAWHHLVGSYDGQTMSLYIDGALGESKPAAKSIVAVTGGWTVGGQNCVCTSNYLNGAIDELAIYDHALAPSRIAAHYHASGR